MGNCLNPASNHLGLGGAEMMTKEEEEESLAELRRISHVLQEEEEQAEAVQADDDAEDVRIETAASAAEGLKVKIVLTRAELERLMAQLKTGERRLQDVLQHMPAVKGAVARADRDGGGWRPRLESIVECPETAAVLDLTATAAY